MAACGAVFDPVCLKQERGREFHKILNQSVILAETWSLCCCSSQERSEHKNPANRGDLVICTKSNKTCHNYAYTTMKCMHNYGLHIKIGQTIKTCETACCVSFCFFLSRWACLQSQLQPAGSQADWKVDRVMWSSVMESERDKWVFCNIFQRLYLVH